MEDRKTNEVETLQELKNKIIEVERQTEARNKLLLSAENVIGFTSVATLVSSIIGASTGDFSDLIKAAFIVSGTTIFIAGCSFALKIEQVAGYYKCSKCGYADIPEKYSKVFFAPHFGRTRYMKCPKCEERSWHKKVLTKDTELKK